jgi:hypothetical protein
MTQNFLIEPRSLLLAVVMAAILLIGCGDDSDSEGGETGDIAVETGSLTKAQFIERADAICKEEEEQREKLIGNFISSSTQGGNASTQATTLVNTVLAPGYQRTIERISTLGAPADDEDEVTAFLTAFQKSVEEGVNEPLTFIRNPEPFPEAVRLSDKYGFEVCLA